MKDSKIETGALVIGAGGINYIDKLLEVSMRSDLK
jgi:hypothetical protein